MELKLITKADLEWARKVRNRYRQYFNSQGIINSKQQREWFTKYKGSFFIIWVDKKRAGTVSVSKEEEIGNVLLLKRYESKGIFKQVLKSIEADFSQHLSLEVRVDNKHAIEVYKKLGFKIVSYKMRK
jgi:ribosomal protein S18 acetylase RimI-like enzyme